MVKSVYNSQKELLQNMIDLHLKGEQIDVDPTYSTGNFYKKTGIQIPRFISDISPKDDSIYAADARALPFGDSTVRSIMFDPPFITGTGKSLLTTDSSNNKTARRFGLFPNEKELHTFYRDCLIEFHRILEHDGKVMFKCQDKVSSSIQYFSHVFIMNQAQEIGFYVKDLFILVAKNRMVPEWHLRNQQHARKFHSYFLVLEKKNKPVNYL